MNKHTDFKPLTSKIYAFMNENKGETDQGYLDSRFDELMEWIDDNYFLTYYGSKFKEDSEKRIVLNVKNKCS